MKKVFAVLGALFSVAYLLNPGAGIFELLPDNLPIIGNLDEAAAVALLLGCLRYLGVDLTRNWERPKIKDVEKN